MKLPQARTSELMEQNADKELLIYDLRIDKAFVLNETSKNVFKACNGKASFDELKLQYNYTDDLIYLALDELKKNDLMQDEYLSPFAGMNRREVIRRVGLASMIALPVISGLVAPSAAHASSIDEPACRPLNECIAAGTPLCPVGCTQTYNFIGYVSSTDGTCSGPETPQTFNCSFIGNGGALNDIKRVA